MNGLKVPGKIYFEKNSLQYLQKMEQVERVLLVTCPLAVTNGFTDTVRHELAKRKNDVKIEVLTIVPNRQEQAVLEGVSLAQSFQADTVIGLGCSQVMHVAKEVATKTAQKLALLPITSGSGEEMKLSKDGTRLADVVLVDGQFVLNNSKEKSAKIGLLVLNNAIGSYLSENANDYTRGFSLQAAKIVVHFLEKSVKIGDFESRERLHNAAAIAGIAANNTAFTGTFSETLARLKDKKQEALAKEIANYIGLEEISAKALVTTIEQLERTVLGE